VCLAHDDLDRSVNQKLTNRPITFHYFIIWQHPAPVSRVWLIIIVVIVFVVVLNFQFFKNTYTPYSISSGEQGIEIAAGKIL
jgi:hypothetical protein